MSGGGTAPARCGDALVYSPRPDWLPMNAVGRAAYVALFAEVGVALFVTTLLGALTGHWLDQQLSTNPIFVVVGFLLGALAGAVADYRLITRFLTRFND